MSIPDTSSVFYESEYLLQQIDYYLDLLNKCQTNNDGVDERLDKYKQQLMSQRKMITINPNEHINYIHHKYPTNRNRPLQYSYTQNNRPSTASSNKLNFQNRTKLKLEADIAKITQQIRYAENNERDTDMVQSLQASRSVLLSKLAQIQRTELGINENDVELKRVQKEMEEKKWQEKLANLYNDVDNPAKSVIDNARIEQLLNEGVEKKYITDDQLKHIKNKQIIAQEKDPELKSMLQQKLFENKTSAALGKLRLSRTKEIYIRGILSKIFFYKRAKKWLKQISPDGYYAKLRELENQYEKFIIGEDNSEALREEFKCTFNAEDDCEKWYTLNTVVDELLAKTRKQWGLIAPLVRPITNRIGIPIYSNELPDVEIEKLNVNLNE